MKNAIYVIVVILVVAGIVWYVSSDRGEVGIRTPAAPAGETEEIAEVEEEVVPAREVKVSGFDFRFEPAELRVSRGEKIRVIFTNEGALPHDLRVDDFGSTSIVQPGGTAWLEFTAPNEPTTLTYYCSVSNHRALGMEGRIVVR